MARIELRHCDIILRDGTGGTAEVADSSIAAGNTTLEITDVVVVGNRTVVPVGAHFRVTGVDEKYLVTAQNSNKVWTVTVDATSGNFTITFEGQTTASILENETAANVQTALEALSTVDAGDLIVTGSAGGPWTIEARGAYLGLSTPVMTVSDVDLAGGAGESITTDQPGAVTWEVTFTPPLVIGDLPVDMDPITILPRELTIKIGDGDLRYTERDEFSYDLDRGELDTVRQADDVPMEVVTNFVYEHITTGTSEDIAPMDAIKRRGDAADWISAATDECEPYAVDLLVKHTPPCGTAEKEFTLFPDFRSEQREVNFGESSIQITGRCNVVEPVTWRGDETDEPV